MKRRASGTSTWAARAPRVMARWLLANLLGKTSAMATNRVGPLRLARYLEGFTAVLLTLNKLNRTQTGIRFTGLP